MPNANNHNLKQQEFDFPHILPDNLYIERRNNTLYISFTGILHCRQVADMVFIEVEFRSPEPLKGQYFPVQDVAFQNPALHPFIKQGTPVEGRAFRNLKGAKTEGWHVCRIEPLGGLDEQPPAARPTFWQRLRASLKR